MKIQLVNVLINYREIKMVLSKGELMNKPDRYIKSVLVLSSDDYISVSSFKKMWIMGLVPLDPSSDMLEKHTR